jgi:polygalacturonase
MLIGTVQVYNVREFGASGDGVRLDTGAIQAAIDRCAEDGGGTVALPPGDYATGTLRLRSRVTLYLAPGSRLLGSRSLDDYDADGIVGNVEDPLYNRCLIYAEDACGIAIVGEGGIDGRGQPDAFPVRAAKAGVAGLERPMLIRFVNCRDVSLRGVSLANAASWGVHLIRCERVRIESVNMDNLANQNNDGFDIDGCRHVMMSNCRIHSGDDAICLKSTSSEPTEYVTVTNCIVSSHTAAVKFGTSSRGGFRCVSIANCVFHDCRLGAIKLLLVDGGVLEDVQISHIVMDRVEGPLFMRLGLRGNTFESPGLRDNGSPEERERQRPAGRLRNVTISHIRATVTAEDKARSGIFITGVPGFPIENVVLDHIHVTFPGGGTEEEARRSVPEDEYRYPEQFFFGALPAYGAYVRHVNGISMRHVRLELASGDARPAIVCEDVKRLELDDLSAAEPDGPAPLLRFVGVHDSVVRGYRPEGSIESFLEMSGGSAETILLVGNGLHRTKEGVRRSEGTA